MSTLPFLLSVADELDNLNSQSYMDDFGLGFHPHRQYYRTPTIQLSLPASTDWMQQERGQRYRNHKFYYGMDNNLQSTGEENEDEVNAAVEAANDDDEDAYTSSRRAFDRYSNEPSTSANCKVRQKYTSPLKCHDLEQTDNAKVSSSSSAATTAAASSSSKIIATTPSSIASNNKANNSNKNKDLKIMAGGSRSGSCGGVGRHDEDDDDNIDNSVRMYNLSKKCCKNYHRHAVETNAKGFQCGGGSAAQYSAGPSTYKLHSKCMEGNNSSSDESLQKVSSSIEFLTCFLLKRSRAPSSSASSSSKNAASSGGGGGKKS